MKYLGLTTALIAATTLAACSKSQNNASSTDTTSAAAATRTDSGTPGATTPTTVTPTDTTAANSANATMTDANLLGKALAGDSAEVAIAKYMMVNTKNAAVKSFAALLQHDHSTGITHVNAVAKKTSLTPQAPANDTTAQETSHVLDNLKSLNGNDRDTAFVNHEIADHQQDIADTKAAVASAQNADVKALLEKELPELQKHLDRAQQVSTRLASKK